MNTQGPREQRILLGIGLMLLASSLFPVMNGLVQWLSQRYPSEQIIWARITGQLVIMAAIMLPAAGLRIFATRRPGLQVARSLCQASSTAFYFFAIATLPLAKATALGFLTPFVVALLAWPLLGEKPEARRMLAVAVAFLGVLVVVQPGVAAFEPATLLILGNIMAFALYQVLTRKVSPYDATDTSVLWSALVGAVVTTLIVPFHWVTPETLVDAGAFLVLGAIGALGHYCVARALGLGPAAVISPFQYWQIVGATIAGFLVTGLWPSGSTWAGAAIVVAAGVFLAVVEGRRRG
jgi:drug/metabolite transporter (DMT)-like permease